MIHKGPRSREVLWACAVTVEANEVKASVYQMICSGTLLQNMYE
jgi:hypothetical protein